MSDINHTKTTVHNCRTLALPHHPSPQGILTSVQNSLEIPFAIRRIYYLYDVPTDSERGGHSLCSEEKIIVAVAGCFDVTIDDGHQQRTITLRRPFEGLYIPPGIWRTLQNFSSGSVALVLSSSKFDENDYIRQYDRFVKTKTE